MAGKPPQDRRVGRVLNRALAAIALGISTQAAWGGGCPDFEAAAGLGTPTAPALEEISGMVASRTAPGVLWVHNDSGDSARIFALRNDGVVLGEYALTGASAEDWEDMAMGPGPDPAQDYLYIGDIGDNARQRDNITLYRIEEPLVSISQSTVVETVSRVETFVLEYPNAPETVYDCEALLVDPANGGVYLVTKQGTGEGTVLVFYAPSLNTEGATSLSQVGSITLGATQFSRVTGGDVSPNGGEILLRQYGGARIWQYTGEPNLGTVLSGDSCLVPTRLEVQSEVIAFTPDGKDFYTTSERPSNGTPQPLYIHRRVLPEGEPEGQVEGEGEGTLEGEAEGQPLLPDHATDQNQDGKIDLTELLRTVQLFNGEEFSCNEAMEDGYAIGAGPQDCPPHSADYAPQDWALNLSEILRVIQLFNLAEYASCTHPESEDGYCGVVDL
jgi:hypothetical protein